MAKSICIVFGIISLISCVDKKEKFNWDAFNPQLAKRGDSIQYSGYDTLKSNGSFEAYLYRDLTEYKDSLGINLIKEFKGYFFEISNDTSESFEADDEYKDFSKFINVANDTAFIAIPTDSIINYGTGVLKWKTGYEVVFTSKADTVYALVGKWYVENR